MVLPPDDRGGVACSQRIEAARRQDRYGRVSLAGYHLRARNLSRSVDSLGGRPAAPAPRRGTAQDAPASAELGRVMRSYALMIVGTALMPAWFFVEWLRGNMSGAAVIAITAAFAIMWLFYSAVWLAMTIWRRRAEAQSASPPPSFGR
ncbi:hypothetical protein CC_2678 [Caulobacter vibrioides CB15]|uniref:Uncharacterized protein n=2 Tax=Caulobacter vibrioides TaxID=155892 RepID=Q9A4Z3_CAUVC|nr:hypothetical protein CC_2678 [Caulobacter vibrioides CB15]ATC29515.1 hypothetical protein CA607_14475 [Caulobacter vibrioides]